MVAAPALTIKRAEKSEGLIAMVPASLRNKQRQGAAMVKKQKILSDHHSLDYL